MKNLCTLLLTLVLGLALALPADAATLTLQTSTFTGINYTSTAASTGDKFTNDGNTILLFVNGNASARTLTIAANSTTQPGFGAITISSTVVTLPGSGTNGGIAMVGPFPTGRFNDSNGQVNYTLDNATGMVVSAVKFPNPL